MGVSNRAFGTVKIAMDNKDGGLRAIKIVNKPADNNEEAMKELRQEMELMNKIGAHQHVLRLYEYSEDESHVYFVHGTYRAMKCKRFRRLEWQ